jgi:hypothetical protein
MMYAHDDDLPFSDEFPDHTDSDTAPEHLVEYCVTSRDKFAAVAHDISQNTGRACQSMRNGIDDCLHGLRGQSTSSRNIRGMKEEDIRDSDEAACGKHGYRRRRTTIEAKTYPFSEPFVDWGICLVSMIKGYQQPLFGRYSSQDIHRFRMNRRGRGRPPGWRGRAPPFRPFRLGLGLSQRRTMGPAPNKIARSPTPPETDDDGEEWPVHGIVGEDVDVFGISRYAHTSPPTHLSKLSPLCPVTRQAHATHVDFYDLPTIHKVRWQNWSRPDGTNTTWMRDIEGDPAFVVSWNEAMKHQRLDKASESQPIDIMQLASIPMHDRLTFERAQAVEEKMAERLQKGAPKVYQGWMAEVDRQVLPHPPRRADNISSSSTVPKKRRREPSLRRYVCPLWSFTPLRTHF